MDYTHPALPEPIDPTEDFSGLDVDVLELVGRGMRTPRYNAGTEPMVYLGGHVENVRRQLEREGYGRHIQFYGLHHDDAEAFLGEVVRSVRAKIDGYDEIEEEVLDSLWESYGVEPPTEWEWQQVMHADDKVLLWELDQIFERDLMRDRVVNKVHANNGWQKSPEELIDEVAKDCRLEYTPEEAREVFEESHRELGLV